MSLKFLFICGSLEPGRDGVGDYISCLAGELNKSGCEVAIVAVNDRYIKQQNLEIRPITTLRIPSLLPERERLSMAKKWIDKYDPAVISIQYVAYSFQIKGLPFTMNRLLQKITRNRQVHIMFHELWLDSPKNFVQKIVAQAQKIIIKNAVALLKPDLINVSIPFNRDRLSSIGIVSSLLPIFGNITRFSEEKTVEVRDKFAAVLNLEVPRILYFGSAPRDGFLTQVIAGLKKYYLTDKSRFQLIIACGVGAHKDHFLQRVKTEFHDADVEAVDVGFLSIDEISYLMQHCDAGIARSQTHMLGKSGSAVAMLEHGMSIWLPKMIPGQFIEQGFRKELVFSGLENAINNQHKPPYLSLIPDTANHFIQQLEKHETKPSFT